MSKYDTMIAYNRKISDEKIRQAKQCMWKLFDEGERVTVPKLVAKTNLSRGFFYKNPAVRSELDRIQEQQIGLTDPRRNILDMAMNTEVERLHRENSLQRREIDRLKEENLKMKKALEKRAMNMIRNM